MRWDRVVAFLSRFTGIGYRPPPPPEEVPIEVRVGIRARHDAAIEFSRELGQLERRLSRIGRR